MGSFLQKSSNTKFTSWSLHIVSTQHVSQSEKTLLITIQKWCQLTAGSFPETLLFCCDQLTQLPAPIMTSLNEYLCLKMLSGQRGGTRVSVCVCAHFATFCRLQQLLISSCWLKGRNKSDEWWFNLQQLETVRPSTSSSLTHTDFTAFSSSFCEFTLMVFLLTSS